MTPSPFLSTVLTSHQPRQDSDFSPVTTTSSETSLEKNLTAETLNGTGAHTTDVENASISITPMVGTKAETLPASTTASAGDVTLPQHEHHNISLTGNSGTEISSPSPTSTLEEKQPNPEVTEPFSTTEGMDDASSATPTLPLNSVLGEVLPLLPVQKVLPKRNLETSVNSHGSFGRRERREMSF